MRVEITNRNGHADGILIERFPVRPQDSRAFRDTPRGEGNVIGDDNILGRRLVRNPIVSGVHAGFNADTFNDRTLGQAHPCIAYEHRIDTVTLGYAHNFVFYRATVGVDEDPQ